MRRHSPDQQGVSNAEVQQMDVQPPTEAGSSPENQLLHVDIKEKVMRKVPPSNLKTDYQGSLEKYDSTEC